MVTIGILRLVILAEALPFRIIIMIHTATLPAVMTLYAEVIVALHRKLRAASTRLQKSLSKGYTRRDTAAVHF